MWEGGFLRGRGLLQGRFEWNSYSPRPLGEGAGVRAYGRKSFLCCAAKELKCWFRLAECKPSPQPLSHGERGFTTNVTRENTPKSLKPAIDL